MNSPEFLVARGACHESFESLPQKVLQIPRSFFRKFAIGMPGVTYFFLSGSSPANKAGQKAAQAAARTGGTPEAEMTTVIQSRGDVDPKERELVN